MHNHPIFIPQCVRFYLHFSWEVPAHVIAVDILKQFLRHRFINAMTDAETTLIPFISASFFRSIEAIFVSSLFHSVQELLHSECRLNYTHIDFIDTI